MENSENLPLKYKAAVLPAYNPNLIRAILGFKTEEREIKSVKPNEVVVKIEAAPCNPSDIAFLQGGYNIVKSLPAVPGFEGSGTVVYCGSEAQALLGKSVCCFTQENSDGTWAEYLVTNARNCMVLKDEIAFEQGACIAINPFTAYGLIELCKRNNCKALIQNAAGGQLAGFIRLLALAHKDNVSVINIVRNNDQVISLTGKGEKYVLNSTNNDFQNELRILASKLKATIAFDAVGGEMTAILFNVMPANSEVVVYGGLSGKDIGGLHPLELIFQNKKLSGFNLNQWIANKTSDELSEISNEIQDYIIKGEFQTNIKASFSLDTIKDGIRTYIKCMSEGKVLFKP